MDSYVARYIIELVYANIDSNLASSYFYKDADSKDSKIYAGPIWDYDLILYEGPFYEESNVDVCGAIYLCGDMLSHDSVKEAFSRVYDSVKESVQYEVPALMFRTNGKIARSRDLNRIRWDLGEFDSVTFLENTADFLKVRLNTIEERLIGEDPYCYVAFYDYEGNLFASREVLRGEAIEDIPAASSWTSIFNGWTEAGTGKALTKETRIYSDTAYISNWIDVSLIVQNGINISGLDVENVDIETLEKVVEDIKARQGAAND